MKQLALLGALLPSLAMADIDTSFGLGLGTQYGGFAGIKYSAGINTHKFYVGAGFANLPRAHDDEYGLTLGWEKALFDRHSLGLAIRTKKDDIPGGFYPDPTSDQPTLVPYKDTYRSFIAATYTFYFNSYDEAGFLTGLSVGKTYRHNSVTDHPEYFLEPREGFDSGVEYGLYFGYQF